MTPGHDGAVGRVTTKPTEFLLFNVPMAVQAGATVADCLIAAGHLIEQALNAVEIVGQCGATLCPDDQQHVWAAISMLTVADAINEAGKQAEGCG